MLMFETVLKVLCLRLYSKFQKVWQQNRRGEFDSQTGISPDDKIKFIPACHQA